MWNAKTRHQLEEQGQGFLTSTTSESEIDIGGAEVAERLAGELCPGQAHNQTPRLTQPQNKSNQNTREQKGTVGNVAATGSEEEAAAVVTASSDKAAAAASNNNSIAATSSDKAAAAEDNATDTVDNAAAAAATAGKATGTTAAGAARSRAPSTTPITRN
jgi:hypothetical protein